MTPRVLEPPARIGKGLCVYPSATAMVWPGEGHAHEAVAVPGVRLAPGDVLVEVELATVCESDVHAISGHRVAPAPLVLGHEQVGRVVALGHGGAKTTDGHRISIGERIVWSVALACGRCVRCRRGLGHACLTVQRYGHERMRRGWELSGGFATHAHVLAGTPMIAVPDEIPAAVLAPASCATATAAAAVEAASEIALLDGAVVVVTGAGMRGLTAAAMAADAGARVVVTDGDPARRELALTFGARAVADPAAGADAPGGLQAAIVRAGGRGGAPTAVLATAGGTDHGIMRRLIGAMDVAGVLVLVGSAPPRREMTVDAERVVGRLLTIRGVRGYAPRHLESAVRFLAGAWQRYPFAEQVGRTFDLADVDAALALAATAELTRVGLAAR